MIRIVGLLAFAATALSFQSPVIASSETDIDKMTTYAVILGRGIACGADSATASSRVGAWMDRVFPPGSQDQKLYLPIFVQGVQYHAQLQRNGKTPDSCATVNRNFNSFPWP